VRRLAALMIWIAPAAAWPCSPCPGLYWQADPPPDAADVPLNVHPRLTFDCNWVASIDPAHLRLWDASGCSVPGEWIEVPSFVVGEIGRQIFEFVPDADLDTDAWYAIAHAYPEGCGTFDPCDPGEIVEVARFQAGDARDDTPPTFGGASGATCSYDECPEDEGCCGPYAGWSVFVTHVLPVDDHLRGVRAYLRRGAGAYDFTTASGGSSAAFYTSSLGGEPQWALPAGPDPVFVMLRAYDAAGNEDANAVEIDVEAQAGCAGVLPDAWAYAYPTASARVVDDCVGEPVLETNPDGPIADPAADAAPQGDGGVTAASRGCGCNIGARP
jgi:hypothetical protein